MAQLPDDRALPGKLLIVEGIVVSGDTVFTARLIVSLTSIGVRSSQRVAPTQFQQERRCKVPCVLM